MKRVLSVIIITVLCCGLMTGCSNTETKTKNYINSEPNEKKETEIQQKETGERKEAKINTGDIYDGVKAVSDKIGLRGVELTNIVDASKGINTLITSIDAPITEIKESIAAYMIAIKEIINECTPALSKYSFNYIIYAYAPGVGLGDLRIKTELRDGGWRLSEGEIGNATAELGASPVVLEQYPDIVDDLNYAIEVSGLSELQ